MISKKKKGGSNNNINSNKIQYKTWDRMLWEEIKKKEFNNLSNNPDNKVIKRNNYKTWKDTQPINKVIGFNSNEEVNDLFKTPQTQDTLTKKEFINSPYINSIAESIYGDSNTNELSNAKKQAYDELLWQNITGEDFTSDNNSVKSQISKNNFRNWMSKPSYPSGKIPRNNLNVDNAFKVQKTGDSLTKNQFDESPYIEDLAIFYYGNPVDKLWSEIKDLKGEDLSTPLKLIDLKEFVLERGSSISNKIKKHKNPTYEKRSIGLEFPEYSEDKFWTDIRTNNYKSKYGNQPTSTPSAIQYSNIMLQNLKKNNIKSINSLKSLSERVYPSKVALGGKRYKKKTNKKINRKRKKRTKRR